MNNFERLSPFFQQAWSTITIAFKRLLTQRFLSLAAIAGLTIASGFILSIPMYADATYYRLFRQELFADRPTVLANHPADYTPMDFIFGVNVAGETIPQWSDVVSADKYLSGEAQRAIRYPIEQFVRRFNTDGFFLYEPLEANAVGSQYYLTSVNLAFVSPMQSTVKLVAGHYPAPFKSMLDVDSVEAIVSTSLADQIGITVGDQYFLRQNDVQIPVSIVGVWQPVDPTAKYWDIGYQNWLIVDEASYTGAISEAIHGELTSGVWYFVADGSRLHSTDVPGFDRRITAIQNRASGLLPDVKLVASPLEALQRYQKNAPYLTYLLYAFSVPILGLILAFIGLVTGLFVGQQRGEMAILRSRGASSAQVILISMLQGAILGVISLAGGVLVGYWIAVAIGKAKSFMDFSLAGGLRVEVTGPILVYGLVGIGVILLVQILIPTLGAAGNTIVTYKQERARLLRPPWWQRYWLDVILLLPAGYGLFELYYQNAHASANAGSAPNPLQNPLLIIAPAIAIFSIALFLLRFIPRLMAYISSTLRPTKSVGVLMATRYLARSPAFYSAPLVLLLLTLGLSAFTASLAKTLDAQLVKQSNYQVGADMNIYELGTTVNTGGGSGPATPTSPGSGSSSTSASPSTSVYTFGQVEDHLKLNGVRGATRVGRYTASALVGTSTIQGTFLGVDRTTFPSVAYWQRNFAFLSLNTLMGRLGANPNGVLVPNSLLQDANLKIGDSIILGVQASGSGDSVPLELTIVGGYNLFPTWYPTNGPMFVGNLDNLFVQAGSDYPHEVWLRTASNADPEGIVYAVRGYSITLDQTADQSKLVENGLNTLVQNWSSSKLMIVGEQSRPERQGLFGLLSVGFIASALLTVLGFLLYAMFSFRRRFIEMGMLRAIGLSIRQMTTFLAAELASLILIGIVVGTIVGVIISLVFVPFLQMGSNSQTVFPPFQIVIAWFSIFEIYVLFGLLFVAAVAALSAILVRMKIFQAIKLGETS